MQERPLNAFVANEHPKEKRESTKLFRKRNSVVAAWQPLAALGSTQLGVEF